MTVVQYSHIAAELWGALLSVLAVVVVFMTRFSDKKGGNKLINLMVFVALLMVSDSVAWIFRGYTGAAGYYIVRISNFCAFLFGFLVIPLSAEYFSHILSKRSGIPRLYWTNIEWGVFSVAAVCLIVNRFVPFIYDFDERNTYFRTVVGWLPGVLTIFGLVVSVWVVVKYIRYLNKFEKAAMVSCFILPIIGSALQIIFYGISFTYLAIVLSSFITFVSYEYNFMTYNIEMEKRVVEERIRLVNYQIRPHFIFNTLSVIRYLCQNNPEEATQTINEFSGYLRSTTDFLNENDCIPFSRELDLIKHYVYIEQKRFGKSISVAYEINDTDFYVPSFSVQTSVENAINHGLRESGKPDGVVTVKTYISGTDHIIEILDNGAGFDPDNTEESGSGPHVGIKNAKERIKLLTGGEMKISSKVGQGTKVTIVIPESKD